MISSIMKKKLSIILSIIAFLLAIPMLVACVPQNYWLGQGRETKRIGKEMLDKYLKERYSDYKLEDLDVVTGAKEGQVYFKGSYLTKCVSADLYIGDKEYDIYADTETGRIYTEELYDDVKEYIYDEFKPYFIKYGFTGEYVVDRIFMPITIVNHNVENRNETVNTELAITSVFPSDLNVQDLPEFLEENRAIDDNISIWIAYCDEDDKALPEGIYQDFVADHAYMRDSFIRIMKLSNEDVLKIKDGGWWSSDMELLDEVQYTTENKEGIMDIKVENQLVTTDIWILPDTAENRKITVWGTATIKDFAIGDECSVGLIESDTSNAYVVNMIDEDEMYYSAVDVIINQNDKIVITPGEEDMSANVEVYDEDGTLTNSYPMFVARL